MSLDVYLTLKDTVALTHEKVFIREYGQTKEITLEEWYERSLDRDPIVMIPAEEFTTSVYTANITHNLNKMAEEAGLYKFLWRPDEIEITKASQLIEPLENGLQELKSRPGYYKIFNPENGWGTYDGLVKFVENYLQACKEYPEAEVSVWR